MLAILSSITFQYLPQPKLKKKKEDEIGAKGKYCRALHCIIMLVVSFILISIHVIPLAFFINEWINCPYDNGTDICFTVEPFKKSNKSLLAKIVLRDTDTLDTGTYIEYIINIMCLIILFLDVKRGLMQEFIDFSKIALLFSTTANAVSHVLFLFSLWALYFMRWDYINKCINNIWKSFKKCCCGVVSGNNNESNNNSTVMPLDPFDDYCDEEDNFDSSCMGKIYDKKKVKEVMAKRIWKKSCSSGKTGETSDGDLTETDDTANRDLAETDDTANRDLAETDDTANRDLAETDDTANRDLAETDDTANRDDKYSFFEVCDDRTSTPLQGARSWHFIIWFFIGLSLITITASILLSSLEHDKSNNAYGYEISALVLYFVSLYRNLVSCFIFSKLMYGIQRRCEELELFVIYINKECKSPSDDLPAEVNTYIENNCKELTATELNTKKKKILAYLIQRDKDFVETAKATLSWLQLWFLFHWLLHIISTFMVTTLFIDAITLHVKANIKHVQMGINFDPAQMGFLFMYSVTQCFFLFYPCLRAAGVTRTRQRVIRKISNKYKFSNLPDDTITEFIESMKRQKFSFRLRILCASIPFNLNIAYISIAFGFVGIVVSLITSVRSTDFPA